MSEVKKSFVLKKTCAGSVFTIVSPMSNPNVTRIIDLTDRVPQQILPEDWALGFIMDQGNYSLYKNGYVTFDRNEVDFVIQTKNQIIPIEVKSGKSTNNNSLTKYNEKFKPNVSLRFSMNNLVKDGNILNVPLFLLEYIGNLIEL